MKFVCLNCETYMNFEKVEKPGEGSLGVFFGCPSCNAKFSMVTQLRQTNFIRTPLATAPSQSLSAKTFL